MQRRCLRDRDGRACGRGEVASTNSTQRKGTRRLYVWESCHLPQVRSARNAEYPSVSCFLRDIWARPVHNAPQTEAPRQRQHILRLQEGT